MTANKNLLRIKFAHVVEAYAKRTGCTLDEALKAFYGSQTYALMRDGVADMPQFLAGLRRNIKRYHNKPSSVTG